MHFLQELVSNYLKKAHLNRICSSLPVTDKEHPPVIRRRIFSQHISDIPGNSEKNLVLSDLRENGCFMRICILQRLYSLRKRASCKVKRIRCAPYHSDHYSHVSFVPSHEEIPKSSQNRPIAPYGSCKSAGIIFPHSLWLNYFGWIEVDMIFSQTSDFTEIWLT